MYEEKEIKYKKRKKENIPKKKTNKNIESKKVDKDNTKNIKQKNTKVTQSKKVSNKKKSNTKKKKTIKKKNIQFVLPPILKKINWKELLLKLLALLFIMMLLIFTISRIKKHQEQKNANFNNNISIISNATLNYFQENSLPKNIGDSFSFILEEMKNLELISDIKDNDNRFCNYLDSYIILTKTTSEEYRLKIYLKCPNKAKAVEEKFICNDKNCFIKK